MNKFLQFCIDVVAVIMIILTGYLFLLSIYGTSMITGHEAVASAVSDSLHYETTVYLADRPLLHISAIILIFLVGYLFVPRLHRLSGKQINVLLIGIHAVVTAVMIIAIFVCDYLPVTAQYWTVNAAQNLISKDYSFWAYSGFNYIYPLLNSLTLFLVPEVFLFGIEGGVTAFRIFNLGMMLFASYSLYGFCKEIKCNTVITSILFILYLPLELYVFFIYGNIAGLSLSLFSIWMAVRYLMHHKKKNAILCAAGLAAGSLFKDTTLITLIAILIVIGLYGVINHQWKQLLWLPIFLLICLGSNSMVDVVMGGITHEDIPAGMSPYGHLTMGISEGSRASGWYNDFTFNTLVACNYDYELYREVTKEAFRQQSEMFYSDPSYVIRFFSQKTASQWNNPTFQSIWIHQQMIPEEELSGYSLYIDGAPLNMFFYYIFNLVQSIILFGSLCYFIFEAGKSSLASLIPAITFIGGFIFLLFWEAKAQYTLLFFVMLFPYAVTGLISLSGRLTALVKSVNSKTGNDQTGNTPKWYRSKDVIFLGLLICIILLLSVINTESINNTIKPGTADADALYDYYLEQNANYYNQFTAY